MARPDKAATVAELTDRFRESNAVVLTEYRGLTVAQLTQLRTTIKANATYSVVKNTLTQIAARQAGVTAFDGSLSGPTAVAFVTGDAVETAKSLRDFAKTYPALVIKGGVLDGNALTADEVRKLADLESREVLLSKLAGAMKASLTKAAYLFNAPLSQAVRTVDALRLKLAEAQPEAPAEAPAEASAEAPADAPAAADDAPAATDDAAAAPDDAPAAAGDEPATEG